MSKVDEYRRTLRELKQWRPYLLAKSGLPGPRGNLELAHAAALEIDPRRIDAFLSIPIGRAPENTPQVFLVFCGVLALGRLIANGDREQLKRLRPFASDTRWRIREAVAMALQTVGDSNIKFLLREANRWSSGNWYEKRAAAAALAEPRLLTSPSTAVALLEMLDSITASMAQAKDRKSEAFRTLRQGMGYCWSVAVAAHPAFGKRFMQRWLKKADPDVRWMMKENLKKNRLRKMDPAWVNACLASLHS
jgi:HEAT repeat protein